jgi:hypothetical protein
MHSKIISVRNDDARAVASSSKYSLFEELVSSTLSGTSVFYRLALSIHNCILNVVLAELVPYLKQFKVLCTAVDALCER